MAENKTKPTKANVLDFLNKVKPIEKQKDCHTLLKLFKKITGEKPYMLGTSIVAFGMFHYKSERSSQEGDWLRTGFSPRAQNLTIYIMPGFKNYQDILKNLGKFKTSVSCLYIKKLSDINLKYLEKLILASIKDLAKKYP